MNSQESRLPNRQITSRDISGDMDRRFGSIKASRALNHDAGFRSLQLPLGCATAAPAASLRLFLGWTCNWGGGGGGRGGGRHLVFTVTCRLEVDKRPIATLPHSPTHYHPVWRRGSSKHLTMHYLNMLRESVHSFCFAMLRVRCSSGVELWIRLVWLYSSGFRCFGRSGLSVGLWCWILTLFGIEEMKRLFLSRFIFRGRRRGRVGSGGG